MRGTRILAAAIMLTFAGTSAAWAQTAPASPLSADEPPPPPALPLFDYAFGIGVGHTDNLNRNSVDPVSQNILQPTFNFTINQQGSTLQAQVVGLLQYTDYLEGYLGNEFRGQLTGQMNWVISPQRLNFEVQDYSSVQPVNTRLGNAPGNQQQVNVFVAGPSLSFLLGSGGAWSGKVDLRYIDTAASKTKEFESQRGFMAARVIHDLSATDHLSFNLEDVHVNFDNADPTTTATRYDEYNAYARYQSRLAHVDIDLSLGGSRVSFTQGWPGHSGMLARASIAWRVDTKNTLLLNGFDQLADATANLEQPPDLASAALTNPAILVGSTVISAAVFRDRNVTVGYTYQGPRFGFRLLPYYAQLRQLNGDALSRNGYGVVAGATYLLTPLMTLDASLGNQTTRYGSDQSRDHDHTASVSLSRQFTPHWSWSVAFRHDQRQANRPGFGYTENEVFGYVYYRR